MKIAEAVLIRDSVRITEHPFGNCHWRCHPDSALNKNGKPLFIPDFDPVFEATPSMAVRIDRLGKSIQAKFAGRYYNELALAVTTKARELFNHLSTAGLPTEAACCFDQSVTIGEYFNKALLQDNIKEAVFSIGTDTVTCTLDGLPGMIDDFISNISRFNTLKTGDILLLPLSDSKFELHFPSRMEGAINGMTLLKFNIR